MSDAVLTINAGSSSLKFALFDAAADGPEICRGEIENLDTAPRFFAKNLAGETLVTQNWTLCKKPSFAEILHIMMDFCETHLQNRKIIAVGHRIVHGGADHIAPEFLTPALLASLRKLTPLDPLHMPHNLAPIEVFARRQPDLAQVACFDTAFHHTLPPVAKYFALPRELSAAGLRRYGFHGLSYEFISGKLQRDVPSMARGKTIVAHLGSGASLCALDNSVSIATTTGFSALDGLVMATRCGRIDPGILLYLGAQGKNFPEIEDLLYRRCGMLGVSGISGDVRTLLASTDPHAAEAIALFTYQIAVEIGGLTSALGGLHGLVFTAGIGENAPAIRAAVCARLAWLDLRLDAAANAVNAPCISTPDSVIQVRVMATDEEAMIARHTNAVFRAATPGGA